MSISSIGASVYAGAYGGMSASNSSPIGETSAKDEFLKYQAMTPAQKMRAAMLAKLGVTEEQLKAMGPEDRAKIEQKLKDMIKQQVQNDPDKKDKTGQIADVLA
ncbi:hypothetical protein [Caulobacter sp. UC70_42]|uniref:hypothetical protein n=1 Tax=Caulobacter sp. UC70_42 TaxID=3374551 RepID=UPI0037568E5F